MQNDIQRFCLTIIQRRIQIIEETESSFMTFIGTKLFFITDTGRNYYVVEPQEVNIVLILVNVH